MFDDQPAKAHPRVPAAARGAAWGGMHRPTLLAFDAPNLPVGAAVKFSCTARLFWRTIGICACLRGVSVQEVPLS